MGMIGGSSVGRAHFELAGGRRNWLTVTICYPILIAILAGVFTYMTNSASRPIPIRYRAEAAMNLLYFIQIFFLALGGTGRVAGAVRTDLSSQMIESHRLMPGGNFSAAIGYLLGPTSFALTLSALTIPMILLAAGYAHVNFTDVVLNESTLFASTLVIWSIAAVGSFVTRLIVPIITGALVLCAGMSGETNIVPLPGLYMLVNAFVRPFYLRGSPTAAVNQWLDSLYGLSFALQLLAILLFLYGASRRYRGSFRTTYPMWAAPLVVLVWTGSSAVGIGAAETMHAIHSASPEEVLGMQAVCALCITLLILAIPLNTVMANARTTRSLVVGGGLTILALTAMASMIPMMVVKSAGTPKATVGVTAGIFGAQALLMLSVLSVSRRFSRVPGILVFIVIVMMAWVGPLLLEMVRLMVSAAGEEPTFGMFGNASPFGALGYLVKAQTDVPIVGVVAQWGVAAVAFAIAVMVAKVAKTRRVAAVEKKGLILSDSSTVASL